MKNQRKFTKKTWTILNTLSWTTSYFKYHKIDYPRTAAEILLSNVLNMEKIELYLHYDKPLLSDELAAFKNLIKRRVRREPVAYIVGSKEFWSIKLAVTNDVLIPRPETECLVKAILELMKQKKRNCDACMKIIELGTGSGAIILALASEKSLYRNIYFASDSSKEALNVAKKNAVAHNLEDQIYFFLSDWFKSIKKGGFDIIVSNPPYIPTDEIDTLEPEICCYEPRIALDGGKYGYDCLGKIILEAHHYLKKSGHLILEIGFNQKQYISKLIESVGHYNNIKFLKDYSGHDRVVVIDRE